jgi:hypothetical protein
MKVESYEEFKVGDLITTYHEGYWELTSIELRSDPVDDLGNTMNPLFEYEKVAEFNMTEASGYNLCDASFCKKVDKAFMESKRVQMSWEIGCIKRLIEKNDETR